MSRKQAFIKAVEFSPQEITSLWKGSPNTPTKSRPANCAKVLDEMLISKAMLARCLGVTLHEIRLSLRGVSNNQLRFDAFLELLQQGFQSKKDVFLASWVAQPVKPAIKSNRSNALAIRKDSPYSLVDASDLPEELENKMGWNLFENITALAGATGVCRSTLLRIRDGFLVRRSSRDKVRNLVKVSTRTIKLRLRPASA